MVSKLILEKTIAFSIHLIISAIAIISILIYIKITWFQGALFSLERVWSAFQILILVDVVLGPLMTFIVFKPKKKTIVFDLSIIFILQIAALMYGISVIKNQRPSIITFVGDRFEVIIESEFNTDTLPKDFFDLKALEMPQLTYSLPGISEQEKSDFIINDTQYQKDLSRHRQLKEYMGVILSKQLEPNLITPHTEQSKATYNAFLNRNNTSNCFLLPIQGTYDDAKIIAINTDTLKIIEVLELDPWTDYNQPKSLE